MARITPCRRLISDRFPVASFVVEVPPDRAFEVACATDASLFHADQASRRTPANFCTSRLGGLMRAPAGQATYIVPPDQLRRFAGSTRLYYALGTYGSARGDDPRFSIAFDRLQDSPCIQLSPDFTGRALDRGRFSRATPAPARYGAVGTAPLVWGADQALRAAAAGANPRHRPRLGHVPDYDDGFDQSLWTRTLGDAAGGASDATSPSESSERRASADRASVPEDLPGESYEADVEETDAGESAEAGEQLVSNQDAGAAACTLLPVPGIERVSAAFKTKVCEIATRLGADANHLMAMMSHESGLDPARKNNQGSGAVGLIQFMPDTAAGLGTTPEALAAMTGEQQLDYVEKFFRPYKGRLATVEDLYIAGLWPVAVGKPGDTILFSRPSRVYDQNKGLDVNGDGHVTKAEAAIGVTRILEAAQRKASAATAQATRAMPSPAYEDAPDLWRPRGAPRYAGPASAARARSAPAATLRTRVPQRRAHALADTPAVDADAAAQTPAAADTDLALSGRYAEYSDVLLPEPELPVEALRARVLAAPHALGPADRLRIIDVVSRFEGGASGYAAVNPDGEFRDPGLPQYQKTHVGLSWGFVQFAQRHGTLGLVLQACQRRDPAAFAASFGPASEQLLGVTMAATEEERLSPVEGARLWEEPWLQRFRDAGAVPAFQAAQREVADQHSLVPNLPWADGLGFTTDRALAFVFDRCVHMGNGTGTRWMVGTAGPIRSQKQLAAALAAVSQPDLAAFQTSVGLPAGPWNATTHAALVGALRRLGAASPIALPSLEGMLDTLVGAARDRAKSGDKAWTVIARRLGTLRTTTELTDAAFEVV